MYVVYVRLFVLFRMYSYGEFHGGQLFRNLNVTGTAFVSFKSTVFIDEKYHLTRFND